MVTRGLGVPHDAFGNVLAENDDVAMLGPAIFTRNDRVSATMVSIKLHLVPKGGEATIIGIESEGDGAAAFEYFHLESCEGVSFYFATPDAVKFVRGSKDKSKDA